MRVPFCLPFVIFLLASCVDNEGTPSTDDMRDEAERARAHLHAADEFVRRENLIRDPCQMFKVIVEDAPEKYSPLTYATYTNNAALALQEMSRLGLDGTELRTALADAASADSTDVVAAILATAPHADQNHALIAAAQCGSTASARMLLDAGADVQYFHEGVGDAMLLAIADGHIDTAKLLLNRGYDACLWRNPANGGTLRDLAEHHNQLELAALLPACNGDGTVPAKTPNS